MPIIKDKEKEEEFQNELRSHLKGYVYLLIRRNYVYRHDNILASAVKLVRTNLMKTYSDESKLRDTLRRELKDFVPNSIVSFL